jgi:hypothetical protein
MADYTESKADGFWKRVRRQARKETGMWLQTHLAVPMVSLLAAAIGIFIVWQIGTKEGALDELLLRATATGVIVLLLPWVYWWKLIEIPARWDSEKTLELNKQAQEIQRLNATTEKRLKIAFWPEDHEPQDMTLEIGDIEGALREQRRAVLLSGRQLHDVKAVVKNTSSTETVDDVRVTLISRRRLNYKYGQPWPSRPHRDLCVFGKTNTYSISVDPQREVAFRLCLVKRPSEGEPSLVMAPDTEGKPLEVPAGDYVLTVKASGRGTAFDQASYFISVDHTRLAFGPHTLPTNATGGEINRS